MPPAARRFDLTIQTGLPPHVGFITGVCAPNVLINGMAAARVDDGHTCLLPPLAGPHPPNKIASGSMTVLINGKPAARVQDWTACGTQIVTGALNVLIGD